DLLRLPTRPTEARSAVGHRPLLWREAAGHELRRERAAQERTQRDVADAAGISIQYLSEIERGRKEPSSEVLEAAAGALGLGLADLARRVAEAVDGAAVEPIVAVPDGGRSPGLDGPVLLAA